MQMNEMIAAKKCDSTNVALRSLYFYLTKGCNLKCRHCWIAPTYKSVGDVLTSLPVEVFKSIISQALPLGLTSVKLTGGEPFLHPDIWSILDFIRDTGLSLNIETNGVLCSPDLAEQVRSSSTKVCVSVSIDGSDAQTHDWMRGVPGSFEKAIAGLSNLVRTGVSTQVIMSVAKCNKDQITDVVNLADRIGVGSVKLNPVQPTARGAAMHDAEETLTVQELVAIGEHIDNTLSLSTRLKLIYTRPLAFSPLASILGSGDNGCGVCSILNILGVLADGSYALCGIGETVPELVLGHAEKDLLENIWQNSELLADLRHGLPGKLKGICRDCLLNGMCKGSCIAQNYYTTKDLWSSFWFCEQAYKAGLFPEGRLYRRAE